MRWIIEGKVPLGLTKFRPNDQRMFNFIFRRRYDIALASFIDKADFRSAGLNTDVLTVLYAIALAVHWMSEHPECGVAASIMSQITTEADYVHPVRKRGVACQGEIGYAQF